MVHRSADDDAPVYELFQPSFKLMERIRNGSAVVKRYSPPRHALGLADATRGGHDDARARLSEHRAALDPVALLHTIREARSLLTALTAPDLRPTPHGDSLEQFLAGLPGQWSRDETHFPRAHEMTAPRTWRTREDPFAGCGAMCSVSCRKNRTPARWRFPTATAKHIWYPATQGAAVARHHGQKLVFGSAAEALADPGAMPELALVGSDPKC